MNSDSPSGTMPRLRIGVATGRLTTEPATVMSAIALAVANAGSVTKPELVRQTQLARATVDSNLNTLIRSGLLSPVGESRTSRYGRPAETIGLTWHDGVVLIVDLSPHHVRVVAADLSQRVCAQRSWDEDIKTGPEAVIEHVAARLEALLAELPRAVPLALVASIPGPVDIHRGVAVRPPIMPGWDEYPIRDALLERFGCPVFIDNDVNVMALGESRALPSEELPLLVVKVGTGIGGGLVGSNGDVHRGADGSAGDIGHLPVPGHDGIVCKCGNRDCVEAIASLDAMARRLGESEDKTVTHLEFLERVRTGEGNATSLVRDAAAQIGDVVAMLVHVYNPAHITIAGTITHASDDLLAGVRSAVYRRALPLATRNLIITHSVLQAESVVAGGLVLGIEMVLGPQQIFATLERISSSA